MKKILLVVPSLGIGGQEKIAINTAHCLKDDYDVKLVVFNREDVEFDTTYEIVNLNAPPKKGTFAKFINQIRRIFKLASLRRKEKADFVISFGYTANITNVGSDLLSCGKTITSIHGFSKVKKALSLKMTLMLSDKVICIAKAMQTELLKIYPKAKNTVVVENGYDIDDVIEKSNEPIDETFPKNTVIAMGRLDKVKGFDRLIKAISIVKKSVPSVNLIIVGKGELLDNLSDIAKSEGISNSVHFLGFKKNPYCYLRQADIFVLSSRNEGFPNALIESLACQKPIVATDCESGPREILSEVYSDEKIRGIVEEKYGILVEHSGDENYTVKLLADAILSLIENPEKCRLYKERALARARTFDETAYKNKIVNIMSTFN